MATSTRLYANITVYKEGALFTEENQVRITRDYGNKPVYTVARGWAGIVKGASEIRVSIRSAVPSTGVEYDPGPDGVSCVKRTYTFVRGGQQLTADLMVLTDETGHQVNNESEMNYDLMGKMTQWSPL
ncbi:MAG: hypothetical protein WC551_07660 [Patescibacteria group bacterium]